jgi:hypothetical protein
VELVVALMLLGIVLGVGYLFFDYGYRSFVVGELQSNLQRDVRTAAGVITRELRPAHAVIISNDTVPRSDLLAAGYNYLILEPVASGRYRIKRIDSTGETVFKTEGVITALEFEGRDRLLLFRIAGTDGEQSYEIKSQVLLLNTSAAAAPGCTLAYAKTPRL